MEGNLFGTIEDGFDSVFLEPRGILGGFPATDPDTGYDLIGVFFWCSSLCRHPLFSHSGRFRFGYNRSVADTRLFGVPPYILISKR
jgi:hypothetical protein